MKRIALLAAALLTVLVAIGCSGQTEPATELGPTTARLNGLVNCTSDNSGEWWFELAADNGHPAQFSFDQVGPQNSFDCPPDENPSQAGYQCSAGPCNGPFPVSYKINPLGVSMKPCQAYVFRIRARIDTGNGGSAYMWVDSNGLVNDNVYDEIPAQRPGTTC